MACPTKEAKISYRIEQHFDGKKQIDLGKMLVTSTSGQVRIASPHEITSNYIIQSIIMDGRPIRIGMDPIEERMREIGFAVDFIERRTLLNENEYEDNHWYVGKLPCRFAGLKWCRLQWKYRCGPDGVIYDDSDGWHDVTPPWRTSVSSRIKRNHRYYACKDPSTCPYYAYRSVAPICVSHASDPTLHWELKCETVRKKEEKD